MKKLIISAVAALGLAACVDIIPPAVLLGDVQLPVVGEETVWKSTDYQGKPVFIIFMASWCPHCQHAMPAVAALAEEFGDQVEFVGAFVDSDAEAVKIAAKEHGLTIKAVYDSSEVGQSLGVNGIPHAILFDKKHRALGDGRWEGFAPDLVDQYRAALKKVVK